MKFSKKAELGMAGAVIAVVGILAFVYLIAQFYTPGATTQPIGTPGQPTPITPGTLPCSYAPTAQLGANDKYDSGQTNWGNWKYKLNGGTTTTDADGSFEVSKSDKLDVLVADGNSSAYYRAVAFPCLEGGNLVLCSDESKRASMACEKNSLAFNNVVKYSSYETKCYDEDGDAINGTTYPERYLTIGSGSSRTVKCELTGVADTGVPYGGILVLEFNQTVYEEDVMDVQWDGVKTSKISSPSAYTVGVAGATSKSFSIPPFEDTGTHTFYIDLKAETNDNPGKSNATTQTTYGDGIFGRIYPINCFEEEDVTPSEFRCLVEDIDDTFTSPGGTGKDGADITTFGINVD